MKTTNYLMFRWVCACLLFAMYISPVSAASLIEVGSMRFDDTFKDREEWLQMEIELIAHPTSDSNPENPNYLKNVKMKVTMVYDNNTKTKKSSGQKFVYFQSMVTFSMLEKSERVNMYFYLPGDVIKYYRLSKRPKYYYLNFSHGGQEVPPESKHFSSGFPTKYLESFLSEAGKYAGQTKGMLLPIHLAPPHVTTRADLRKLPSIARTEPEK